MSKTLTERWNKEAEKLPAQSWYKLPAVLVVHYPLHPYTSNAIYKMFIHKNYPYLKIFSRQEKMMHFIKSYVKIH
jgi:hypothetical protein